MTWKYIFYVVHVINFFENKQYFVQIFSIFDKIVHHIKVTSCDQQSHDVFENNKGI